MTSRKKCLPGCECGRHKPWNKGIKCLPDCICWRHDPEYRKKLSESTKLSDHSYKVGLKQSLETIAKRAEKNKISCLGRNHNGMPAVGFYITEQGYRCLTGQIHPLVHRGEVLEHRAVLYDKIGPGPHECYWHSVSGCGKTALEWGGLTGIIADHLDDDQLNNDPNNLVPTCNGCNRRRSSPINGWTNSMKESIRV